MSSDFFLRRHLQPNKRLIFTLTDLHLHANIGHDFHVPAPSAASRSSTHTLMQLPFSVQFLCFQRFPLSFAQGELTTRLESIASALLFYDGALQTLCFQNVSRSFPCNGGGGGSSFPSPTDHGSLPTDQAFTPILVFFTGHQSRVTSHRATFSSLDPVLE